jgi:hypothetical protein
MTIYRSQIHCQVSQAYATSEVGQKVFLPITQTEKQRRHNTRL